MKQPIKHYFAMAPVAAGTHKTKKVSQDFEGVFLTIMFENMFEGLDEDGPLGSGNGNGVWRSLLTEEYAK
jgi:peptidoglycan hydrolase FlgJ